MKLANEYYKALSELTQAQLNSAMVADTDEEEQGEQASTVQPLNARRRNRLRRRFGSRSYVRVYNPAL